MDLKQLENIIAISEEKSITKAASRLFLTQSALNQQLQKLEADIGTPLFVRARSDWQLTAAGRIYVDAAKSIINIKKDAYSQIRDMTDASNRRYTIGLIPERGVNMFTEIYPLFHSVYPEITLEPQECNVRTMQKLITKGEIDLGLITLCQDQKDDNTYISMGIEEIFLAVPESHPLAYLGSSDAVDAPDISLQKFSTDPFIQMSPTSTFYQLVEGLFSSAGFEPKILFYTISNISKHRLVKAGVGCSLLPASFAKTADGIVYFRLDTHPTWEITMCYRKGAYLSSAEKYFLELCKKYWE